MLVCAVPGADHVVFDGDVPRVDYLCLFGIRSGIIERNLQCACMRRENNTISLTLRRLLVRPYAVEHLVGFEVMITG